jgi:tetratricopeptide (TPR) repeat protein
MIDLLKLTALIFLSTLSVAVIAHPDLVLQIESLDIQLESNPTDSESLIKRGDLYRRHEDYPAAARDFAAARKISPENTLLDFYEGHLLFDSGKPEAAERHFEKYLSNHPQHAKAWALRGETSIRLKQAEPAAVYFANAITYAQSASPALYRSQILSLLSIGQARWGDASQVVDLGLEHFGLEVSLLGLGIDIALASNRPLRATHYLETLPEALRNLSQWQIRIQTTSCLASTDVEASAQCLQRARFQLASEVNAFMAE